MPNIINRTIDFLVIRTKMAKNTSRGLLRAGDIMHTPITVDKGASIRDAAQVMDKNDIGSVLVEDAGQITGISTEEDILKAVMRGIDPDRRKISEIMTGAVRTVGSDTDIDGISGILSKRHIRRLGVTENGDIVGILTAIELIRHYSEHLTTAEGAMQNVVILPQQHSLYDAVTAMTEDNDSVLIREDNNLYIITEKDVVKAIASGLGADTPVSKIMNDVTHTIKFDDDINKAWKIFNEFNIMRLPVTKNGDVIGIVTTRDLLRPYHSSLVTARDIVWTKVSAVTSDASVGDAINAIDPYYTGCVLIVSPASGTRNILKDNIWGIVTERDVIRAIARNVDLEKNVSEIMCDVVHTIDAYDGIDEIIERFVKYHVRRLPVIYKDTSLIGILTVRDILWPYHLHKINAENVMCEPVTAGEDISIKRAAEIMDSKGIGSILIMRNDNLLGIITESDMLNVIRWGMDPEKKVSGIMTGIVRTVEYDTELDDLSEIFHKRHVRRLPITKEGKIAGIVTINELLFKE